MTKLANIIRSVGLMPLLKPLAERAAAMMDLRIVPKAQVPSVGWLGLPALPVRTILDVGACRGGFAQEILLPRFTDAVVHSFEPSPDAFTELEKKARTSKRHIAHNYGLGERAETMVLHSAVDALPASSLLPSTEINTTAFPQVSRTEERSVEIKVLDEIAAKLSPAINNDLLVKIDVQGFEDRVIRGGRKTIAKACAVIVEIQKAYLYKGQPTFQEINKELNDLGLYFTGVLDQFAGDDGRVLYYDAVFLRET